MLSGNHERTRARRALLVFVLFGWISAAGVAHALPIINGSFQSGPAVGSFLTVGAGSTALTGWEVFGAGVDIVGTAWISSDGDRSLDLNALATGGVRQILDTVIGQAYQVRFDLSRNPAGSAPSYALDVAAGAASETFTFTATPTTGNMLWEERLFEFTATSTSTVLEFGSLVGGSGGPALDNVRVDAVLPVPEPSTATLTLVALSGLAVLRKRRAS